MVRVQAIIVMRRTPCPFALGSFTTVRFGARYISELGDRAGVFPHQFLAESSEGRYVESFRVHVGDVVAGFDI